MCTATSSGATAALPAPSMLTKRGLSYGLLAAKAAIALLAGLRAAPGSGTSGRFTDPRSRRRTTSIRRRTLSPIWSSLSTSSPPCSQAFRTADGTYTITNTRNGCIKTYRAGITGGRSRDSRHAEIRHYTCRHSKLFGDSTSRNHWDIHVMEMAEAPGRCVKSPRAREHGGDVRQLAHGLTTFEALAGNNYKNFDVSHNHSYAHGCIELLWCGRIRTTVYSPSRMLKLVNHVRKLFCGPGVARERIRQVMN